MNWLQTNTVILTSFEVLCLHEEAGKGDDDDEEEDEDEGVGPSSPLSCAESEPGHREKRGNKTYLFIVVLLLFISRPGLRCCDWAVFHTCL